MDLSSLVVDAHELDASSLSLNSQEGGHSAAPGPEFHQTSQFVPVEELLPQGKVCPGLSDRKTGERVLSVWKPHTLWKTHLGSDQRLLEVLDLPERLQMTRVQFVSPLHVVERTGVVGVSHTADAPEERRFRAA